MAEPRDALQIAVAAAERDVHIPAAYRPCACMPVEVRYIVSEEHREDGTAALAAIRPWKRLLRRERAARAWQAMQAWMLLCCLEWRGSQDTAFLVGLLVKESGL